MNETLRSILGRRSIRTYKSDNVPKELIDALVQAGLYAPSAKGRQSCHLCVIHNPDRIRQLNQALKQASKAPGHDTYRDYVASEDYSVNYSTAPLFVIATHPPGSPGADCAVALENMMVAAHSLGLGSCWINQLGPVDTEPGFRALLTELGVPEGNRVAGAACFGYPAAPAPVPVPRTDARYIIVE